MNPSPAADRRTLIRRATYDLTGLPPTPEEVESFVDDRAPDAFARVVDRLLASPAYGERWGRHWLDVVRYADARDLIQLPAESDFHESWRYRDWVVGAFNRDMSYADFVRFQVAGDLLPPPRPGGIDPDAIVATGLLALADFVPGDVDKDQMIADYVNDQVNLVGKAFLGLTIGCARCHDHKFDPISAEDYYALAGIFFSTSLVPGPVPGNTPLIRRPLLSADEIARLRAREPPSTVAGVRSWNNSSRTRTTARGSPTWDDSSPASRPVSRGGLRAPAERHVAARVRPKRPARHEPCQGEDGGLSTPQGVLAGLAVRLPSKRSGSQARTAGRHPTLLAGGGRHSSRGPALILTDAATGKLRAGPDPGAADSNGPRTLRTREAATRVIRGNRPVR